MKKRWYKLAPTPNHLVWGLAGIAALALAAVFIFSDDLRRFFVRPPGEEPPVETERQDTKPDAITVVAENLSIPWEIAFLPDGDLLVTERPGTLLRIGKDRKTYAIEGVEHIGEGGLLGMALHPKFSENRWIYLYLTTREGGGLRNRVERYRLENYSLTEKVVILEGIPGAAVHDGGRMAFGPASASDGATAGKPDFYLYITTGDAGRPNSAQDKNSLAGKILRLRDDGSIPADNPFDNAVYSYGHRNSQGLAWDEKGRLWATEHGRSGILSGFDELNLIEKGKNYGWPLVQGDEAREGMEKPVAHSGPDQTWAPAGAAFLPARRSLGEGGNGSLFFAGLRGESLYQARITGERQAEIKTHFSKEFGRIRAVVLGTDWFLYLSTSNTDNRGEPRPGDDKIIRIDPWVFTQK